MAETMILTLNCPECHERPPHHRLDCSRGSRRREDAPTVAATGWTTTFEEWPPASGDDQPVVLAWDTMLDSENGGWREAALVEDDDPRAYDLTDEGALVEISAPGLYAWTDDGTAVETATHWLPWPGRPGEVD
jgi:hypothetical protein